MLLLATQVADPSPGAVLLAFTLVAVALFIFFLPSFVAAKRHHPNLGSIIVINLLLGPIFGIGWVVALAWSVSAIR